MSDVAPGRSSFFQRRAAALACLAGALAPLALSAAPARAQKLREVVIGLSSASLITAPLQLAKQFGFYRKYGLEPRFVVMDSGGAAMAGLIGGSFAAIVANTSDLVAAAGQGQKVALLAGIYQGLGATFVIDKQVAEASGVSPQAPVAERLKALDGLLIALPSATSSYTVAFKAMLQAAHVTVASTYLAAANMPAALESGAVKGFITSAPFWMIPVVKGTAVVWISGPQGDIPEQLRPVSTLAIEMMAGFAAQNPDIVAGLRGAMTEFGQRLQADPDGVKAATAKLYPSLDPAAIDLFFRTESSAWVARPYTRSDMLHDIGFVKGGGVTISGVDRLKPEDLIIP